MGALQNLNLSLIPVQAKDWLIDRTERYLSTPGASGHILQVHRSVATLLSYVYVRPKEMGLY